MKQLYQNLFVQNQQLLKRISRDHQIIVSRHFFIENGKTVFEKNVPAETFNNHFANIVEKSCKIKPQFVCFSF